MTSRRTITVEGMACAGCEQNVESALAAVEGVRRAEADNEAGTVEVVADEETDEKTLRAAIRDAGYDPAPA